MYGASIYNDVVPISSYKTVWEKIRLPYLFHLAKTSHQNNRLSLKCQNFMFEGPLFYNGGFPEQYIL